MPEILNGREAILKYLADNHIRQSSLAKVYGLPRQDVYAILKGRKNDKRANEFVLKVINDYGIK
ncbi:hypothetical protein [Fructilactobacillus florum]|uniref:hypothetical protein n=1 Tax=Fructilactobacillus florum TaxID=640331 RepID=UPI0006D26333|nr:hypothetical protein [Fructilactobacillus florum]